MSKIAVVLQFIPRSKDFLFFYGPALTRGQGEQDTIILSRIVDFLIKVTLSRATGTFFRLGCDLCPRGLPWSTGWPMNIILSRIVVVLRLVTLSRVFLFFYGLVLTRGQGDQDIMILFRIADVLIKATLSRATAIFICLGCAQCSEGLPWATGWQLNLIMSRIAVVLRLGTLSRDFLLLWT